jgi:hypothetical protein
VTWKAGQRVQIVNGRHWACGELALVCSGTNLAGWIALVLVVSGREVVVREDDVERAPLAGDVAGPHLDDGTRAGDTHRTDQAGRGGAGTPDPALGHEGGMTPHMTQHDATDGRGSSVATLDGKRA